MFAVTAALVFLGLAVAYVGPSNGDDTFIYMRYSANFLGGEGLVFNPGEASYGMTSILWCLVATIPASMLGNDIGTWKAASFACYGILAAVTVHACMKGAWRGPWALLLAVALLLEPHLLRWSGTGMENSFAALAIFVFVLLSQRQARPTGPAFDPALGVLGGLLPFVRPELGLLAALYFGEGYLRAGADKRSGVVKIAFVSFITGLAMLLVVHLLTGAWVPQTAIAKSLFLKQKATGYALSHALEVMISGIGPMLVLSVLLYRADVAARSILRPALIFLAVIFLYLSVTNQLVSTRYDVSMDFPLMAATVVALLGGARTGHRALLSRSLVALQIAMSLAVAAILYPATRTNEDTDIGEFAQGSCALLPQDARVALREIGSFAAHCPRYIVDMIGLTDLQTLQWIRENGGRASTVPQLEKLFSDRQVTHYVDTFGQVQPISGIDYRFEPLYQREVRRGNLSAGSVKVDTWRLYAVKRKSYP